MHLNITLPIDVFASVASGDKRIVSHKRNPRLDRYFSAKSPDSAKINGEFFVITKIDKTLTDYVIHVKAQGPKPLV
jgi:hypothetical protein